MLYDSSRISLNINKIISSSDLVENKMVRIKMNHHIKFLVVVVTNLISNSFPHEDLIVHTWSNHSISQFDHHLYKDSPNVLPRKQYFNSPMYRILRPGSFAYHSYPIVPQFSTANIFNTQLLGFPSINIPQILQLIGCTKFLELIRKANLEEYLEASGPFTVFAPENEAFDNVNITNFDEDDLYNIVLLHVVPKRLRLLEVILNGKQELKTQSEQILEVFQTSNGFTIGGSSLLIQYSDNVASNGIVHVLKHIAVPSGIKQKIGQLRPEVRSTVENDRSVPKQSQSESELLIKTRLGKIKGTYINKYVVAWLGIPYAEPPLGKLRFRPPQEKESWNEDVIVHTDRLPNACMQLPDETFGNFSGSQSWNPNTEISENCLYLNVYKPRTNSNKKLPVFVWIYGGGFTTGSASLDVYNPTKLVQLGNILFVSFQYRVGSHGFLFMGKDSSAPGNVGLLDQVMVLRWIQNNIESFGGDKNQVTIAGESAGANSVALHLLSPLSCGLFHRAILQSTGAAARWGFMNSTQAFNRSMKLAKLVGCEENETNNSTTVECLQNKESKELLKKEYEVEEYTINFFPFVPTVDQNFLPASPKKMMRHGTIDPSVDVLIGNNANEGFWSLMYYLPDLMPNKELNDSQKILDDAEYHKYVHDIFNFHPKRVQNLIAYEYQDRVPGRYDLFNALDQMVADSDFVCDVEDFAENLVRNGNKVYRYFYNHRASNDPWPVWTGSKHGDEVQILFGLPLQNPKMFKSEEVKFSNDIIRYWMNFVRTGSPNEWNSFRSWPLYNPPYWKYLNLTVGEIGLTGQKSMRSKCIFWNSILYPFISDNDNVKDEKYLQSMRKCDMNK